MTHVVALPCVNCKYKDCVVTCPVDCFYELPEMLVINPHECIDCAACVAACPVEAIYYENDLPNDWKHFTKINRVLSEHYPNITPENQNER